jgi:4-amino-4-deoxy-L-arabinose transferase-like glycosyltransferase
VTTSTYPPEVAAAGRHHATVPARPGRLRRLVRGSTDQPAWVRPAAGGLLLLTAVLYLWGLGASGYANEFYAAAVQAGTKSWKALLFGALDAGSAITVDKPPAALWIMGLSGRLFGFSSWSMLVPQALEGVAAVGLLYATVKRWSGPVTGLVAGALFAVTPVAVLMFRFNNPDALLTLLLVAGAYCLTRAVERGSTRWLVLAGTAIGFGFLTKMMQAFLVLPAFALVFLIAAPGRWYRRVGQLLAAGLAVVVSAGWFVALVELWPAASRAYIGGSTDNSELELALGYNGLGRLFGEGDGAGGGGTGGGGFGGAAGLTRMFNSNFGTQISWLLPAALIAVVAGLALAYRAPRTDRFRAGVLLWGLWTLVTGLTFSYMSGIVHEYYTVALAPGIAGLVAVVGVALWRRGDLAARAVLALMAAVTAGWSYLLLDRTPSWHPWLRYAVAAVGVAAVALLLIDRRYLGRLAMVGTLSLVLAGFGASTAYAVSTAATAHNGSTPTAGPSVARSGMGGGRPGGNPTGGDGQPGGTGERPSGGMPSGMTPPGGSSSSSNAPSGSGNQTMGGGASASSALVKLLRATSSSRVTWSAAVSGSQSAASLELASDTSVMAIGGWSGSDAYPTLAQFEQYVADGKIRYYVAGGQQGGPGGRNGTSSAIATWVAARYTKLTVGGQTVYDLTRPLS